MITIPVTVAGDHWLNPEQVHTELELSDPGESLVLDICAEGPSLWRLGLIDSVLTHCKLKGRSTDTVYISRWSNPVEPIPFQRTGNTDISHFYWGAERYWPQDMIPCEKGYLWGFFMGRPTVPRISLLQALDRDGDALLSRMKGGVIPNSDQGINLDHQEFGSCQDLKDWYHSADIHSLDDACIRDQYNKDKNTNLALLAFYHRFHIEIVAESYVYGETFFPTEKTVRPLSAGKPIVVMGPKYFLRRLRDQGFDTWGDLWDESYDDLEGPARLAAILELMHDVRQRRQQVIAATHRQTEHNRATLARLIQRHRPGQ